MSPSLQEDTTLPRYADFRYIGANLNDMIYVASTHPTFYGLSGETFGLPVRAIAQLTCPF
jgi:hypothetical protein